MKKNLITILLMVASAAVSYAQTYNPAEHAKIESSRADGKQISTYAIVHEMLKNTKPSYEYKKGMTEAQFKLWQEDVRLAMAKIMKVPDVKQVAAKPKKVSSEPREGYVIEKWEFYPFDNAVGTFYVLVPKVLKGDKTPGVLCIPGSGRTKESLVGEPELNNPSKPGNTNPKVAMALEMVKAGYVAVAVDNAAAGEAADQEMMMEDWWDFDYDVTSRVLLELGWSWLGYTSYMNSHALEWMRNCDYIDPARIIVSGFSLGTEPMMVLGVLNPDIYAFVYNDFLCQTQERALVMTMPNEKGRREFPNSIRHLIPEFWNYFNFPDIVASLAPRPIIFTEGGLDRDFRTVQDAYKTAGAEGMAACHHYPKYADKANRKDVESLPEGLDRATFFDSANVDTKSHYFKYELVMPWLAEVLFSE